MENQIVMKLQMDYLEKDNWAHLLKRWHAINSCATIARLNKYWRVWTRASAIAHHSLTGLGEGSSGPLESLEKFTHYFVQCQLQMLSTGTEFCILQYYHPESETFHY